MRISDWSSDVCSSDLVRAHAPDIGILALVPSVTESVLIPVLHSGADTYCPASASVELVAAAVSGMFRRMFRPAMGAPVPTLPHWFLSDQAWVLVGAGGGRVSLTAGERAFLSTLFGAPRMRASHGDLTAALRKASGKSFVPR